MNKINYFFGKVYSFFMTAVWVLLFAIGTLIAFLFYAVLRIFQLKKIADDVMWGSGRFWCKAITYMLGAKVSVIGKENIPEAGIGKHCIVANHESYLDITNILGFCKIRTGFVAKSSLRFVPFLNLWMVAFDCTYLKRGNPKSSVEVMRKSVENVKNGTTMVIFPEGHRSRSGHIEAFKHGSLKLAIRSKADIVPIAMIGSRSTFESRSGLFPRPHIVISVLNHISGDNLDKDQKEALALDVENIIRKEADRIKKEVLK